MIIVMRAGAARSDIERVVDRVRRAGLATHLSEGEDRTVIGVIGHDPYTIKDAFTHDPAVENVIRITKPYKLSGREFRRADSVVSLPNGTRIGGGAVAVIAGPCSVEDEDMLVETAIAVRDAGAHVLRGGAFKPRTSPYAFQGLGRDGLRHLATAREATGMPVITEVMTPSEVDAVAEVADIVQVGARNMQNFDLLRAVGSQPRPVLVKRGLSSTIEEWLLSAEYVLSQGNYNVLLCERGIRTFEPSMRNTLDIAAVPLLRELSHLPVVVDPSHATGRWSLVAACARAAVAAGADAVMVEVHPRPDDALSDGPQSLTPANFAALVPQLAAVAAAIDRRMAPPIAAPAGEAGAVAAG
ncbi:MAG TPA: 3-deoxy-7-phosphoheptulonate synthase [Candidatus Dormibacteraeota bacterium]|nr:3-deoxy-7-phosphoheptulonate synthase [Candidatus Dormibacteraeota bacterium]